MYQLLLTLTHSLVTLTYLLLILIWCTRWHSGRMRSVSRKHLPTDRFVPVARNWPIYFSWWMTYYCDSSGTVCGGGCSDGESVQIFLKNHMYMIDTHEVKYHWDHQDIWSCDSVRVIWKRSCDETILISVETV
jgi:hypothetical protein